VIQVGTEDMLVTGGTAPTGNDVATLTVTRGYFGTTAATHNNGAPVLKVPASSPVTVTLQPGTYIMAGGGFHVCGNVTLNAPNVLIYSTNDPAAPTATYGTVGQVELNTSGSVTLGPQTPTQDPLYAGFTIWEDRNQVVVPPSSFTASNYGQLQTLTADISSSDEVFDVTGTSGSIAACSAVNNTPNCIRAGNLIQIGSEMMMVTKVTSDSAATSQITVTRGYYGTQEGAHSAGASVKSVAEGGTTCQGKKSTPSDYDIAFLNAGTAPGASGPLSTISGTMYAAGPRADFENTFLGVANLAVLTSCININTGAVPAGSPTSEFDFNSGPGGPAGITEGLSQ
jgi:hypothetical protein